MTAGPRRARGRGPDDADEARFLAAYDPSLYERLSVAVDVVLVSARDGDLRTLVVRRAEHPDRGRWALPGTFVQPAESLEQAAERALRAKAGLTDVFLEQLYTFGLPGRDPRTRVISVAYYALVEPARFAGVATHGRPPGERPADAGADEVLTPRIHVPWKGEDGGPVEVIDDGGAGAGAPLALAFDHAEILGTAVKRLRGKLDYAPLGFEMLGATFTLLELQRVHETVLGRALNKDSFRRRMLATGLLKATGRSQTGVEHRPAELYRFARPARR